MRAAVVMMSSLAVALATGCEQRADEGAGPSRPSDGGSGGTTGGGSPVPFADLRISPVDGTTGWMNPEITLSLYDPSNRVVDAAKLSEVAGQAFLQTWPDRTPVPFTSAVGGDVDAGATTSEKTVRIGFDGLAADRWYIVGLKALPQAVHGVTNDDGTVGSRFRPASGARLRQVQFCEKEGAGMKFLALFSEAFDLGAGDAPPVQVEIDGAAATCMLYDNRPGEFYFTCPGLKPDSAVKVTVPAGIQSAAGGSIEPGSWSANIATLKVVASACRGFSTPIP